ncbi:hypothetical protein [Sorangium sp. So ce341]|uniref:hypothetical protein n=1 Tax=Sorangium sp. So ce341 TaxID=3133302 RepID=UPI003F62E3DB
MTKKSDIERWSDVVQQMNAAEVPANTVPLHVLLGAEAISRQAQEALLLRNKLAALLVERMGLVRSAARFVFRSQPEIVREVTSAYERRKRAAARRSKAQPGPAPAAPPPAAPSPAVPAAPLDG